MLGKNINLVLDGFILADKPSVLKKLASFVNKGSESLHLVADFDRTITKHKTKNGKNISTWEILGKYLPATAQAKYRQFYEIYRPKEVANSMTIEDAINWWEGILYLYIDNQIKLKDIENDLKTNMPIRDGAKELFEICSRKAVPTVIISAGLADVINLWCQRMEIYPSIVISTKLSFSDTGHINGWDKNSLVHTLNKKEQGHEKVSKIRQIRPNTILIGDSISDANMVAGEKEVIRILVNDPRSDDLDSRRNQKVPAGFDLMTKTGSLTPITDLLNLF